ncbi:hypothetical protein QCA50_014542 [Cerrena zonata]|uniref:DUF6699 domain-containing protein n=1 Tax=Cerrena zonata TaxID=2478898 RepID=A0AAW0FSR2_9APHY
MAQELIRIEVAKNLVLTVARFGDDDTPSLTSSRPSATPSPSPPTPPIIYSTKPKLPFNSSLLGESFNNEEEKQSPPSPPLPLIPIEMHFMLSAPAFAAHATPPLDWNVTIDPMFVYATPLHSTVPYASLEPATIPHEKAITIRCPQLLWNIDVNALNNRRVTVHDVFHTIYRNLRTPITHEEYENMAADPENLEAVIRAYEARYRAIRDDPAARKLEKGKGLKRVDMLTTHVMFAGLSATDKPNEFILNVRSS